MNDTLDMTNKAEAETRCGFVVLTGAPNAGKSTLMNRMVGSKVSIVTHKAQTTRARIRGIALSDDSQLIFVDTPGIFEPSNRLERAMVVAAWQGVAEADAVAVIYDAARRKVDGNTRRIIEGLKEQKIKATLVLNKIDCIKREKLLEMVVGFQATGVFDNIFMISATEGDGVDDLLCHLGQQLPKSVWLYPEDQLSDLPMRMLAAEITREKLFLNLHEELPYNLTVETDRWEEFKDGSVRISQTIYVQRDAHKAMCLGKGGRTIKLIRSQAQEELQVEQQRPVHLFLFVKVREKWVDDPARYREMGLDFGP